MRDVLLQDLCPLDLSERPVIWPSGRVAYHEVANALAPARATPTTCACAFSRHMSTRVRTAGPRPA